MKSLLMYRNGIDITVKLKNKPSGTESFPRPLTLQLYLYKVGISVGSNSVFIGVQFFGGSLEFGFRGRKLLL